MIILYNDRTKRHLSTSEHHRSLLRHHQKLLLKDIQELYFVPRDILLDMKDIAQDLRNSCFSALTQRQSSKKGILFYFKQKNKRG
jgi:hypothetical protein